MMQRSLTLHTQRRSLHAMEKCGMPRLTETEQVTYRGCSYDCVMYEKRR